MFINTKSIIITTTDLQLVNKVKTKGLHLSYKTFEKIVFFDSVDQRDEVFSSIIICLGEDK